MQTKTVQGYFGPKQISREDYIKQWKEHFGQLYHLTETTAEFKELLVMSERIAELAGVKWDNIKD